MSLPELTPAGQGPGLPPRPPSHRHDFSDPAPWRVAPGHRRTPDTAHLIVDPGRHALAAAHGFTITDVRLLPPQLFWQGIAMIVENLPRKSRKLTAGNSLTRKVHPKPHPHDSNPAALPPQNPENPDNPRRIAFGLTSLRDREESSKGRKQESKKCAGKAAEKRKKGRGAASGKREKKRKRGGGRGRR